uniref:Uncharacterized protein n=1 Tax=Spermophilus dauricus TaxID=99837 RepID=A0A8C9P140_SPEDA
MEGERGEDRKTGTGGGEMLPAEHRATPESAGRARLPAALSAAKAPPSTACAPEPLSAPRWRTAFPRRFPGAGSPPGCPHSRLRLGFQLPAAAHSLTSANPRLAGTRVEPLPTAGAPLGDEGGVATPRGKSISSEHLCVLSGGSLSHVAPASRAAGSSPRSRQAQASTVGPFQCGQCACIREKITWGMPQAGGAG